MRRVAFDIFALVDSKCGREKSERNFSVLKQEWLVSGGDSGEAGTGGRSPGSGSDGPDPH